jgi:CheY-like chemotaxis protein
MPRARAWREPPKIETFEGDDHLAPALRTRKVAHQKVEPKDVEPVSVKGKTGARKTTAFSAGHFEPAASMAVCLAGQRILVVEDDPFLSLDMTDRLEAVGASKVEVARTAAAALEAISRETYTLGLLDANLGGESSQGVAAVLADRRIPFMFVTGYGASALPPAFRHMPLLLKPFSEQQLHSALRILLNI